MIETILLARNRKTGAYVPLSKFGDDWTTLKAALADFDPETHAEYDRVGLYRLEPQKKVLQLATAEEHGKAKALRASQEAEFKKAEALGKSSIEDLREIAAELKLEKITKATSRSEIVAAIIAAQKGTKSAVRNEGPTVAEFVAAGYDPEKYPPQGYVSRSTPEEIAAAVAAFKAKAKDAAEFEAVKKHTDEKAAKRQ